MVLVKRAKTWADPDSSATLHAPTEETLAETANALKSEVSKLKVVGIVLAALIEPRDIQDLHAHLSLLLGEYELALPDMPGLDLSRVEAEWQRLRSNIPELWKFNVDGREFQVGDAMRERGLTAHHPVILIPGIISTGLESWSTEPDYRAFFRQKLWGGFNMLSQVTFNRDKWIATMMLDPVTGLDPPGAKIRAAEGIDAASSFVQGYWIWSKIVENLAAVNYDTNNLHLAPYDWRLSYYNLEERDGYFSRLKSTIEGFKQRQNRKTVIVAHSMGATVLLVRPSISVRITLVSFCCSTFSSGSNRRHTAAAGLTGSRTTSRRTSPSPEHIWVSQNLCRLPVRRDEGHSADEPRGRYILERFFSRAERQKLFRSWAGSASMWIKGGDAIWGTPHGAPDDAHDCAHSHGQLIAFREPPPPPSGSDAGVEAMTPNMTADAASDWILQHTPSSFQKMIATNFSFGIERDEAVLKANDADHTKWSNPLERSYWYAQSPKEYDETADKAAGADPQCVDPNDGACLVPTPFDTPLARKSGLNPKIQNGVKMGEGDGTVSLVSLGAMCRWNPAEIKVTTVELPHRPVPSIPRGGANTSDHVDILGSTGLNEIILKVATGVGDEITDSFVSDIREYARKMHWD
ncbi:Lecithin:cholesterol acyltransferase-domain-containing protein [Mycena leptocephala]|nr:Lecithin:cholesterol acyltransferase-domain-containing protein [Mycena leptocephala]